MNTEITELLKRAQAIVEHFDAFAGHEFVSLSAASRAEISNVCRGLRGAVERQDQKLGHAMKLMVNAGEVALLEQATADLYKKSCEHLLDIAEQSFGITPLPNATLQERGKVVAFVHRLRRTR